MQALSLELNREYMYNVSLIYHGYIWFCSREKWNEMTDRSTCKPAVQRDITVLRLPLKGKINGVLEHDSALQRYTGPGTSRANTLL